MNEPKIKNPVKCIFRESNSSLLFLFFCFLPFLGNAQSGILKGTVKDGTTKETIPGANIFVIDQASDSKKGTVTDINGNYLLELPAGKNKLVCTYVGMENDTSEILIETDKISYLNFDLKEQSRELDVVVISAGKFEQNLEDITVSMEIIKPQLIENKNTVTIETALEQVPGLTILDQEPQIRGGSGFTFGVGSRVAIVVDGMPLLSGDAGRPEWGFIPVENLDQIEVIKGAASVLYGSSALNGVINMRTSYPGIKPETKISFTTGAYSKPEIDSATWWDAKIQGYGGMSFLHKRRIKNLDLVIGGNFFYDMGFIGPPAITDPQIVDTITDFITHKEVDKTRGRLNFNLRYRSEKIKGLDFGLNGNAMISRGNFSLAWLNDSSGIYRAYPGAVSLQDQIIFNFDPFINFFSNENVKHSLRTRIFRTDNKITNNQSNEATLYYAEYQFHRKWDYIPGLNFTAGVLTSHSRSKAQLYASSGRPENQIFNAAGYAQIDQKLWKILNLSGGIRIEHFEMNNVESVTKPIFRAGMNLRVMKATWFRTSLGQGFRFPTITERFILTNTGTFGVFPNPNLQPETSKCFEIGFKQGFKIGKFMGYFDMAGFHQEFYNTIEYLFGLWDVNIAPAGFKFLNTGDTRVRGLDISIMGRTEINKDFSVTLLGGYTYVEPVCLQPRNVYATDNAPGGPQNLSYINTSMDTTNYILKYRFRHSAKIDADVLYKKWNTGFSTRYYGAMQNIDKAFYDLEVLTQFIPQIADIYYLDYWADHKNKAVIIFDCRLGYEFKKGNRLAVVVNNVLNKSYSLRPMKIESPRTIAVQYLWKF